ncbi:hypothetical protein PF004_g11566 [Phytophthora fragariae]|uniref:Uncharacterized protein n=1 Tax=Phytophthora fragariae TaxID=53985 RepID=A0A6G0NXN1_9STRA|nr:hypothetical protein PF004_g11566 [Phytophthora fragariae]
MLRCSTCATPSTLLLSTTRSSRSIWPRTPPLSRAPTSRMLAPRCCSARTRSPPKTSMSC